MDLQENAKGKADLYFHAYFWVEYLKHFHNLQETFCMTPSTGLVVDRPITPRSGMGGRKTPAPAKDPTSATRDAEESLTGKDDSGIQPNTSNSPLKLSDKKQRRSGDIPAKTDRSMSGRKPLETTVSSSNTLLNPSLKVLMWNNEIGDKYGFMKRLSGLASTIGKVITNVNKYTFAKEQYDGYIKKFAGEAQKYSDRKLKYLEEIQRALFVAQIANDKKSLYLIEKLLIQLMGFCDIAVRDQAVILLNMLYDGVDW